ncbi:MAG: glycerate kinase [Opitutaceae bacterium]|nr:glycerate kinase [Opitutaceae bacterium]
MRTLIAFDKFKDSLTAPDACALAAAALAERRPGWTIESCPLADGGEGFSDILTRSVGGRLLNREVTGPRGGRQAASFGLVTKDSIPAPARTLLDLPATNGAGTEVAVIEMATASGLALLSSAQRDPWQTTSRGTGELLRAAAEAGARSVLLGVGGSATHDLGLGALAALGFRFLDGNGAPVDPPVPADWDRIVRIEVPPDLSLPPVAIACDVTNPLLGPRGAAAVYGPQKGLRPQDLSRLEASSLRLAELVSGACGRPAALRDVPGAGAAGGIAFGLMTAVGARLLPGFDLVAAWLDLETRLSRADLLITGEGRFDESSLEGKGPGAVAARALALGKPVHVFAGQVTAAGRPGLHLHAITPAGLPLAQALREAPERLAHSVSSAFGSA